MHSVVKEVLHLSPTAPSLRLVRKDRVIENGAVYIRDDKVADISVTRTRHVVAPETYHVDAALRMGYCTCSSAVVHADEI